MNKKATIFIIEDDPDAAEVMKVTLQAKDYKVLTASEPEKGFAKAKQAKPDLIILDVMFGKQEMTKGFDYAVKMKQDKDLAVVLEPLSGRRAVGIRQDFRTVDDRALLEIVQGRLAAALPEERANRGFDLATVNECPAQRMRRIFGCVIV